MRLLLIGLLPLALSGCWTGLNLYSASDARPAIPSGVYQAATSDAPDRVYRVSPLPSGLTMFDGGEKKEVYGFAPLDAGTFVGWMQLDEDAPSTDPNDENQIYALMVKRADGDFMIYAPECKDEDGEVAKQAGATIQTGPSPTCRFPTADALRQALRQLRRDDSSALRLSRIP
jgi:hypothetical protein